MIALANVLTKCGRLAAYKIKQKSKAATKGMACASPQEDRAAVAEPGLRDVIQRTVPQAPNEEETKKLEALGTQEEEQLRALIRTKDTELINEFLRTRSHGDLARIKEKFERDYRDLRTMIEDRGFESHLAEAFAGRFDSVELQNARFLDFAMDGPGTKEDILRMVLLTHTNAELENIKTAYKTKFGKSLVTVVDQETNDWLTDKHFRLFLLQILQCYREEDVEPSKDVEEVARELFIESQKMWRRDSKAEVFRKVLAKYSRVYLRKVFKAFEELSENQHGMTVERAIKNNFGRFCHKGDLCKAFLTIVEHVRNPLTYWATVLHASMKGVGTDERTISYIVNSRCEHDFGAIEKRFQELILKGHLPTSQGDTTFFAFVYGDTGGVKCCGLMPAGSDTGFRDFIITMSGGGNYSEQNLKAERVEFKKIKKEHKKQRKEDKAKENAQLREDAAKKQKAVIKSGPCFGASGNSSSDNSTIASAIEDGASGNSSRLAAGNDDKAEEKAQLVQPGAQPNQFPKEESKHEL